MKMNADSAYIIGASHMEIGCQDYALSMANDKQAIAVVCDGCSTAPHTDVGARIVAHTALNMLRYNGANFLGIAKEDKLLAHRAFSDDVVYQLQKHAEILGSVAENMMQATLMAAFTDGVHYIIFAYGDGVIALQHSDKLEVIRIDYSHNGPQYLGYRLTDVLDRGYHDWSFGQTKILTTDILVSGESTNHRTDTLSYNDPVVLVGQVDDLVSLTVSSDGVQSVRHKSGQPVQELEEAQNLFKYPNYNGLYVKRRVNAFNRNLAKQEKVHEDDLGVASIHFSK